MSSKTLKEKATIAYAVTGTVGLLFTVAMTWGTAAAGYPGRTTLDLAVTGLLVGIVVSLVLEAVVVLIVAVVHMLSAVVAASDRALGATPRVPRHTLPPEGWYADPLQRDTYRWWNGTAWEDRTR